MVNRTRSLAGTNWGRSFLNKAHNASLPAAEVTAQPPAQADKAPKLIPATPVPFEPYRKVYNYPVTANENGSKTIWINNHRVTIPDVDILAAIPKD